MRKWIENRPTGVAATPDESGPFMAEERDMVSIGLETTSLYRLTQSEGYESHIRADHEDIPFAKAIISSSGQPDDGQSCPA